MDDYSGHNSAIKEAKSLLSRHTGHSNVFLLPSGDDAIDAVFGILSALAEAGNKKMTALVPDQAGWLSYKKLPQKHGFEIAEVKTDYGLIDLDDLSEKSKGSFCLIYQNPGGYFVEQDIKAVYEICKKNSCFVILDSSGGLGDRRLSNGKYADFIVGSFGRWKPVFLGYGGFLSFSDSFGIMADDVLQRLNLTDKFNPELLQKLASRLKALPEVNKKYFYLSEKVKKMLLGITGKGSIIHFNSRSFNVVVKCSGYDREKVIRFCRQNSYEFTLCPRYIRVNADAVSIELKRKAL